MSLAGDDWTKHNIFFHGVTVHQHSIQLRFHHQQGEYSRLYRWPILGNLCFFHVLWYQRWRDADTWLWASASGSSDAGLQACVLLGHGSGSRHEAGSPFHAIKVSRILDASAVLMMSIHKRVNEAHHHDPILEASQEHLGDHVMEKISSPRKHRK